MAIEFGPDFGGEFFVGDFPVTEGVEVFAEGVEFESPSVRVPGDRHGPVIYFVDEWAHVLNSSGRAHRNVCFYWDQQRVAHAATGLRAARTATTMATAAAVTATLPTICPGSATSMGNPAMVRKMMVSMKAPTMFDATAALM